MPLNTSLITVAQICSRRPKVLLWHLTFTAILLMTGAACWVFEVDLNVFVYPSSVLLTLTASWILWTWYSLRNTIFEPYPLFVIAAVLFNGGQALLEVFRLNPTGILEGTVSSDILVPALYLVAISLTFLHCGALMAVARTPDRSARPPISESNSSRAARMTGWMLLGVSIVPTVMLLRRSLSLVMDSGYMGLYQGSGPQALPLVLSTFLIPGAIFLMVGSRRTPKLQVLCFVLVGFYVAVWLFLGGRSAATTGCVGVVWAFDRSVRRIPRKMILVAGLVALLAFGLIQQTRGLAGRDRLTLDSQIDAFTNIENPLVAPLSEMGKSLVTLTHTIRLVPEGRGFDWGASYWYAVLMIVPNVGWDVHPAIAHGLLSDWLIKTVDPVVAAAGGGLGFSLIAEAYLNFGWFGAPLFLGLFGYLICRVLLLADSPDLAKQAMIASFLSFLLLFPRGESANVTRGLVWYAIMPYLLMTLLATRGRRRSEVRRGGERFVMKPLLMNSPRLQRRPGVNLLRSSQPLV